MGFIIESMKRIILIPILLFTFLLVGCESEFDRCIEANTEFDEAQYKQKVVSSMFSTTSIENEIYGCLIDKRKKRVNEYMKQGLTNDQAYGLIDNKLENKDFINYCKKQAIATAKNICHSQGVY